MNIKNAIKHFKVVCNHKKHVYYYCKKAGIPMRGILHDLSKFSPIEFFESVKYFDGTKSPIDVCKSHNGHSLAWFHHRGRNPHHYEYFIDNFDSGGLAIEMPYKYAVELICDYLGAGNAYLKSKFSYDAEYQWWIGKKSKPIMMHPNTLKFVDNVLYILTQESENEVLNKKRLHFLYLKSKEE